jgi:hypothetical protein
VIAFVALATTLTQGWRGTLAMLAAATLVVGAGVHIVSSAVNAFALPALASTWEGASATEQANLALIGNALLYLIDGAWAGAITLFHGLPFVLSGLAVIVSGRYPAFWGWLGLAGGLGSLIAGLLLFFGVTGLPTGLSIVCAVIISLYMIVLGVLLWNLPEGES